MSANPQEVEITFRSFAKVGLLIAAVWLVAHLKLFLLVLTGALMLAGTLAPLARKLVARGVKRPWALVVLLFGILAAVAAVGLVTAPPATAQATQFASDLPRLQRGLAEYLGQWPLTASLANTVSTAQSGAVADAVLEKALVYSSQALMLLGYSITTIVLAVYLLSKPEASQGFVYALVSRKHHVMLARILARLEVIVGGYLRGQLITSALMALVVFIVLTAFGLPNAVALAVFAGVADVVPFVGGFIGLAPMVLVALPRGSGVALAIIVIMVTYQEIESRVVVPRVYGQVLRLPAAVVIVALLVGGELMGLAGAVLALPLAAAVRMLIDEIGVELPGDARVADHELKKREALAEMEYQLRSEGASPEEAAVIASEVADEEMPRKI